MSASSYELDCYCKVPDVQDCAVLNEADDIICVEQQVTRINGTDVGQMSPRSIIPAKVPAIHFLWRSHETLMRHLLGLLACFYLMSLAAFCYRKCTIQINGAIEKNILRRRHEFER